MYCKGELVAPYTIHSKQNQSMLLGGANVINPLGGYLLHGVWTSWPQHSTLCLSA